MFRAFAELGGLWVLSVAVGVLVFRSALVYFARGRK